MALAIIFSFTPHPAQANNWYPELEFDLNRFGMQLISPQPAGFSYFETTVYKNPKERLSAPHIAKYKCESFDKYPCVPSATTFLSGQVVAPVCEASETNCLRQVFAESNGEKIQGRFLGYLQDKQFPARPSLGLRGRAASMTLWDIPGVIHAGGSSTYAVSVSYRVQFENGRFRTNSFESSIVPYLEEVDPINREMKAREFIDPDGRPSVGYGAASSGCVWFGRGKCGRAFAFSADYKIGIEIKFERELANWFKARLQDTDLTVTRASSRDNLIRVSGRPIEIPLFSYSLEFRTLPEEIKRFFKKNNLYLNPGVSGTTNDNMHSMAFVEMYRKYVNDTAAATLSVWSFSNIPVGPYLQCLSGSSQILGMVTTNSMTYQGEPPKYKNGFLEYEVAGMHYLPGGEELALGSYELIIKSSVAQCLYGLGKVPLSASVSVVNDKGKKTFATTTVGEKDGWLKLSAKGFTFSKKIIKVKITQKRNGSKK